MPADRELPGGDADRDSDRAAEARSDLDAAFAQIVADWDLPPQDPVPRWPTLEDDDVPGARTHDDTGTADGGHPAEPESSPTLGPRDWDVATGPDHFVPLEPPPLPRGDVITRAAWAGVLLGPLFLLFAGLFWRAVDRTWLAAAAAAFVGGFVILVMRLPHSRDDDDDGAVV